MCFGVESKSKAAILELNNTPKCAQIESNEKWPRWAADRAPIRFPPRLLGPGQSMQRIARTTPRFHFISETTAIRRKIAPGCDARGFLCREINKEAATIRRWILLNGT